MKALLRGRLPLMLALCTLACAARPVHAGSASVSYSTWIVSRDTVMLRFILPVGEAERLTGSAIPVLTVSKLGDYVLQHTAVSASGHDCPAIDQGYDLGRVDPVQVGAGFYGFEIFFRCGAPLQSLIFEDRALFDRAPGHVDFARIEAGTHFAEQLFTAGRERLEVPDPAAAPAAGTGQYVRLGVLHVTRSAERICFLLAAMLFARRRPVRAWGQGASLVLGLAAGYALSLIARATGWVVAQPSLIEAFVGFLVALCAVAIALPGLARPRIAIAGWSVLLLALALVAAGLRVARPAGLLAGAAILSAGFLAICCPAGERRWLASLPAGVFGFLDGFALPALLAPLHLPAWTGARMSIGYDLGALLLESAVIALLAGVFAWAGAGSASPCGVAVTPAAVASRRSAAEILAAAAFAGIGIFWLVSRLHS